MKKFICLLIAIFLMASLSAQVFAATYYDVNVEGLTSDEKKEVVKWLKNEGFEYEIESYDLSDSDVKAIVVEKLSLSEKKTLTAWLENWGYKYTSKEKNGYYNITIKYTSNNKNNLINYLSNKGYSYEGSLKSSKRTGSAYVFANGCLWYVEDGNIELVDKLYSNQIKFVEGKAIIYIDSAKKGKIIKDVTNPQNVNTIAWSVISIKQNSRGYATAFSNGKKNIPIEIDEYDINNKTMTVYMVQGNSLYLLSSNNELEPLYELKYVDNKNNYSNIGFSEWGDLTILVPSGIMKFNEKINKVNEFQNLKDQNGRSVQAKYFTVKNGIIETVTLTDGSIVKLEDD